MPELLASNNVCISRPDKFETVLQGFARQRVHTDTENANLGSSTAGQLEKGKKNIRICWKNCMMNINNNYKNNVLYKICHKSQILSF